MGADLGGTGGRPPNLRWGTAYASVLPIFEVLLKSWQSTNRLKKVSRRKFFLKYTFYVKKRVIYVIYNMSDSRDREKTYKTGRGVTSFPRALVQGSRMGLCFYL